MHATTPFPACPGLHRRQRCQDGSCLSTRWVLMVPKRQEETHPLPEPRRALGRVLGGSWQGHRAALSPSRVAERGWFLAPTPRLELPLSRLALVKQWDTTAKPASASLKSSGEKHRQGSSPGVKASRC